MRRFILTFIVALAATLHAQSSSSQGSPIGSSLCGLLSKDTCDYINKTAANTKFCSEHAVRLSLLIMDDYFVISQQESGKLYPDTLVTKIYSADTSREHPVWTRVYGVKNATPDSVLVLLKEMYQQNKDKADREEIFVSFPYQEKSIYDYKRFLSALKKIGYTKIRLVGYKEEFSDKVYKKLQLKKYSKNEIESWESSKHHCNWDWLRVAENKLMMGKPLHRIINYEPIHKGRPLKNTKAILDQGNTKLHSLRKKFKGSLPRLKDVKTPEHPDAVTQIKITLEITIAPDGSISKMEKLSSNSQNEEFDELIRQEVSRWTFDKAVNSTKVTYPFTFEMD